MGTWPLRCASRRSMRPHRAQPRTSTPPPPLLSCADHTCEPCLGQGEHAKAEACWGEARRTLLAMHAAAQGGKGEPGGSSEAKAARAAAEVQAAGERLELQLCMADCMRCQGRFDESEASSSSSSSSSSRRRRRRRRRRSRSSSRSSSSSSSSSSRRRRRFDDSEASMAKGTLPLPLTSTPTLIPKPKPNPNPAPTPTLPLTRRVCSRGGRGASST